MYNLGDIFELDDEYSDRVDYCLKNGYTIVELEPIDGIRKFQIQEVKPYQKTQEELYRDDLISIEKWFDYYDQQVMQYNRCIRMGISYDKDINELDNQAVLNANRITELRSLLNQ